MENNARVMSTQVGQPDWLRGGTEGFASRNGVHFKTMTRARRREGLPSFSCRCMGAGDAGPRTGGPENALLNNDGAQVDQQSLRSESVSLTSNL
eukprot:767157-Hanusia_phi.AAC.8